jgi:hypothetical protein
MPRTRYFSTPGYARFGIRLQGTTATFNAWYDEQGNLVDAERLDRDGTPQRPTREQRDVLARRGKPPPRVTDRDLDGNYRVSQIIEGKLVQRTYPGRQKYEAQRLFEAEMRKNDE